MVTLGDSYRDDLRRAAEQARCLRDEAAASATEYCVTAAVSALWPALVFQSVGMNERGGKEIARQIIADAQHALFGAWRVGLVGRDDRLEERRGGERSSGWRGEGRNRRQRT